MTPADLKIRREALGLSGEDLAARCEVQARAVRRWEGGTTPVPDFVDDVLLDLEVFTDRLVEGNVAEILKRIDGLGPDEVVEIPAFATDQDLWDAMPEAKPLPAMWFRRVLWRVAERLPVDTVFQFESSSEQPPRFRHT